jgi:hypothetical protein
MICARRHAQINHVFGVARQLEQSLPCSRMPNVNSPILAPREQLVVERDSKRIDGPSLRLVSQNPKRLDGQAPHSDRAVNRSSEDLLSARVNHQRHHRRLCEHCVDLGAFTLVCVGWNFPPPNAVIPRRRIQVATRGKRKVFDSSERCDCQMIIGVSHVPGKTFAHPVQTDTSVAVVVVVGGWWLVIVAASMGRQLSNRCDNDHEAKSDEARCRSGL